MDKFKKIDKEFLITDSSLNCYSYRLLTDGWDLSAYEKNPIGYRMHNRDEGVIVKWVDFRKDGDKVYAKPIINLSHPKGQQTADEIENGFLNGASVGHITALEISTDPKDYLPNQKGPTVKRWRNGEISLVDQPGNYNALTDLVDENDKPINLADFKPQLKNMDKLFLTPAQLAKIPNLKADAAQADVDTAINDLVAKAAKVDTLTADLAAATQKATDAEKKYNDHVTAANKADVEQQITDAVNEGRCTKETGESLKPLYAAKENGATELKALLATMKPYKPITKEMKDGQATDLAAMSWEDLDKAGKLEDLKAKNYDLFCQKFSDAHNGAKYPGAK